ncbi:hypothetical protein KM043_001812 [Ampulex compressa]|nr:hypothetical protein KM043_001812 [Ampulex compressa]
MPALLRATDGDESTRRPASSFLVAGGAVTLSALHDAELTTYNASTAEPLLLEEDRCRTRAAEPRLPAVRAASSSLDHLPERRVPKRVTSRMGESKIARKRQTICPRFAIIEDAEADREDRGGNGGLAVTVRGHR